MRRTATESTRILTAYRAELERALAEGDRGAPLRDRVAAALGVPPRTLRYRLRAWGLAGAVLELERELGWRSWGAGRPLQTCKLGGLP